MKNIIMYKLIVISLLLISIVSCKHKKEDSCCKKSEDSSAVSIANAEISLFDLPGTWTTQENNTVQFKDFKQKVIVMAMIFTHCQSACPRIVADIQAIEKQIPTSEKENVHYVLVSMDPERDTAARLTKFAKEHQLDTKYWTLLNSTESDVLEIAGALNVRAIKLEDGSFDHSNIINIINNKGNIVYQQVGLAVNPAESVSAIKTILKE